MTIKEKEKGLIEEFELFDDWMDKYNYIIDIGKEMTGFSGEEKNDNNLVSGCTSRVWLLADFIDGKLYYRADSDALIPKGIAALLIKLYSGNSPEEIMVHDPVFIKKIGLEQHLSPNRANGLASMINKMKDYAKYYSKSNH
jgi:cysteine desulfuration protein SufE